MRLLQLISTKHHILPPTLELLGVQPSKYPFGGGGYSDVFEGTWNGTAVCVKRLRIYLRAERNALEAEKAKVLQAFLKEAIIWKQLRHKNILPFTGVSITCFPNQMSLISPYMRNGDIMCYLAKHPDDQAPTYPQRLQWLLGAARGMLYIHSMHLYHGDIKGANILIDDCEEARLADLGISSIAVSTSETLGWATATGGGFKGSLRWMAPEVILDSGPSKTTARDIYAFGSTILEVITGQPPWSNVREDAKVILNISQGKRPDRPNDFGNDIWSIIESCWDQDPMTRPSAKTVLERCRLSLSAISKTLGSASTLNDSNLLDSRLLPPLPLPNPEMSPTNANSGVMQAFQISSEKPHLETQERSSAQDEMQFLRIGRDHQPQFYNQFIPQFQFQPDVDHNVHPVPDFHREPGRISPSKPIGKFRPLRRSRSQPHLESERIASLDQNTTIVPFNPPLSRPNLAPRAVPSSSRWAGQHARLGPLDERLQSEFPSPVIPRQYFRRHLPPPPPFIQQPSPLSAQPAMTVLPSPSKSFFKRIFGGIMGNKGDRTPKPTPATPPPPPPPEKRRSRTKSF
ncbi:kinase-like domain-containing protein [Flagelloscypha sp. PMI_526]|nr:kinase-like domain-containing protein [Flagelloscypha sp. PMI_526]